MDISIVLWSLGTLFTIGIFAVKVGLGLGWGGIRWPGAALTLAVYLLLFVLLASLAGRVMMILEPLLRKGPYLHAAMALGLMVWGIHLIRNSGPESGMEGRHRHALPLLVPCPVCLAAMTFSTWTAQGVIRLPALVVGLGLGAAFIVLSSAVCFLSRISARRSPSARQETGLGLAMAGIGFYFIASLVLPAKIEEAKAVYRSFTADGSVIPGNDTIGVLLLLLAAVMIGFFTNHRPAVRRLPLKMKSGGPWRDAVKEEKG